jgi:hypothetical protein
MMHRAPIQIDASEFEVQNGSRVAEVVAMYGSTVLDVQHVGQLKNKKSQAPMLLAVGGLLMLAGTGMFLNEVGQDWKGYQDKLAEANETGGVRPQKPGNGLAGLGVGLALLGLVPFGFGLIRLGDYVNRSYTIGESHGASFHVPPQGLPDGAAFPLVRGSDHEFALNFTQNMQGEVTFDGQSVPLGQLVSSGRAGSAGSSYTFPLPPGANCRVKYNDVTFFVNSVAPGAVIKGGERHGQAVLVLQRRLVRGDRQPAGAHAPDPQRGRRAEPRRDGRGEPLRRLPQRARQAAGGGGAAARGPGEHRRGGRRHRSAPQGRGGQDGQAHLQEQVGPVRDEGPEGRDPADGP